MSPSWSHSRCGTPSASSSVKSCAQSPSSAPITRPSHGGGGGSVSQVTAVSTGSVSTVPVSSVSAVSSVSMGSVSCVSCVSSVPTGSVSVIGSVSSVGGAVCGAPVSTGYGLLAHPRASATPRCQARTALTGHTRPRCT